MQQLSAQLSFWQMTAKQNMFWMTMKMHEKKVLFAFCHAMRKNPQKQFSDPLIVQRAATCFRLMFCSLSFLENLHILFYLKAI